MNEIEGRAYPAVESYEKRDEWDRLKKKILRGGLILAAAFVVSVIVGAATSDPYLIGCMLIVILPCMLWAILMGGIATHDALNEWLNGATTPEEVQRRHEVYLAQKAMAAAALAAAYVVEHEARRRHEQDQLTKEMREYIRTH